MRAYSADGDVSRRESSSEHRFHPLVAEHATAIMRLIIASCSRTTLQQAWQEFTFGHGGKFAGDDLNSELFYSWLRHRWFPRRGTRAARSLCGQSPTRAFLARASTSVDPLLRRYLNACLATPCGFHEILDCTPHRSFVARNVLTETELEVLHLVMAGMRDKQISAILGIALGTTKSHVKHVLNKLNARSRTEAAVIVQRRGLLPPELSLRRGVRHDAFSRAMPATMHG